MNKKSQAALEFLTTYGWAIVVILTMVATLAYFGVLNPSKILPNKCTFGSEFSCIDHQLKAGTTSGEFEVRIKLKNNLGEAIEATPQAPTKDDGTAFAGTTCGALATISGWKAGQSKELVWAGCTGTGLVQGEKGKVLISIKYFATTSSLTYEKEVKGELYSVVQ